VIDLGSDLAGFDDDRGPLWRAMEADKLGTVLALTGSAPDTGHTVPLADLEREGFSTTPPPGYEQMKAARDDRAYLDKMLTWPNPDLPPIKVKLWMPEEADALDDALGAWPGDGFEPTGTMHGDIE
jgi:hypothetical protein